MNPSTPARILLALAACAFAATGCSHDAPTRPWPANTDPMVFGEAADFGVHGIEYQAFGGSKYDAMSIDSTEHDGGAMSLRFAVPDPGDPSGGFVGGAFVAQRPRDLGGYNAVRCRVKASKITGLNEVGLGNDNTGTSKFTVSRSTIPMKTWWTDVVIPIPLASRLGVERGLFYFAEGPQGNAGLTFWLDDITFVHDPTITNPRPALTTGTVGLIAGGTASLSGVTRTTFSVAGADVTVNHMAGYFDFTSSDPTVATVVDGVIHAWAPGTTSLTATLGGTAATGTVTVNVTAPPPSPAPVPTLAASQVIALFSNAYPAYPVQSWRQFAGSGAVQVQDVRIAGDDAKLYTGLANTYVGVQFAAPVITDTTMTALHVDVWAVSGTTFRIKLVDFGADGAFGGAGANADTQSELAFTAATTPALATGAWTSFDLPFTSFAGLAHAHLAQLVLSGDVPTVFVDNVYFHK